MLMKVCATMATPMMMNRTPLRGVLKLKWLVVPRYAWRATIANSSTIVMAVAHPTTGRVFRHPGISVNAQASVNT